MVIQVIVRVIVRSERRIYIRIRFAAGGRKGRRRPVSESYLLHIAYRSAPIAERALPSTSPPPPPQPSPSGRRFSAGRTTSANRSLASEELIAPANFRVDGRAEDIRTAADSRERIWIPTVSHSRTPFLHPGGPPREPRLVKRYRNFVPLPPFSVVSAFLSGADEWRLRNKRINNLRLWTPARISFADSSGSGRQVISGHSHLKIYIYIPFYGSLFSVAAATETIAFVTKIRRNKVARNGSFDGR